MPRAPNPGTASNCVTGLVGTPRVRAAITTQSKQPGAVAYRLIQNAARKAKLPVGRIRSLASAKAARGAIAASHDDSEAARRVRDALSVLIDGLHTPAGVRAWHVETIAALLDGALVLNNDGTTSAKV
jgi:hypothetical protein